jgi:magnesium chelatase subunit H
MLADGNALPESIALVLWGTDNLKNEGGPIAQALALIGAEPRLDSYGRVCGAELIPWRSWAAAHRRGDDPVRHLPRPAAAADQTARRGAYLAATADEPLEQNFVRKHALAYQAAQGCDLRPRRCACSATPTAPTAPTSTTWSTTAAGTTRTSSPRPTPRKCFAYGATASRCAGRAARERARDVQLAYQNLDSVELGVTTLDHYFDTLGGISRAVKRARGGEDVPVYISDQTRGDGKVRTLEEQVALETRTRMLNPKWYEACSSTATRACARSRPRHQHHGLVGHHGAGGALGLRAHDRDLRARRGDARAPGRAEPDGAAKVVQSPARGPRAPVLGAR